MNHHFKEPRAECPRCGEVVRYPTAHDCGGELTFEGVCPLCGKEYSSYTTHLQRCDGGR